MPRIWMSPLIALLIFLVTPKVGIPIVHVLHRRKDVICPGSNGKRAGLGLKPMAPPSLGGSWVQLGCEHRGQESSPLESHHLNHICRVGTPDYSWMASTTLPVRIR
jgi:hypothetical protein